MLFWQQDPRGIDDGAFHTDVLAVAGLAAAGWQVDIPRATMYVWAKIPEPYAALGSLEFTKRLIEGA